VDPAATVIVSGTVAVGSLELRLTIVPPAEAGWDRVSVPVDEFPLTTVLGLKVRTLTGHGSTTSEAVAIAPPVEAVITTFTELATDVVAMGKVA